MYGRLLAVCEMNQIDAVFFGIDGARLCAFITIIYNNLIILAA